MDLEEIIDTMTEAYHGGLKVLRLHTGDPSLYGAVREQMEELRTRRIPCRVSRPEEKIVFTRVGRLSETARAEGIHRLAIIIVDPALEDFPSSDALRSKFYHKGVHACLSRRTVALPSGR